MRHTVRRMPEADSPHAQAGLLLTPSDNQAAELPPGPPILIVAVDTEAEFDWAGPFLRTHTSVRNLQNQRLAQQVFERFGVRPVYLVDYSVATKADGYTPLREFLRSGRCEIGAHLHPWITPPFAEELSDRTSFSQNLNIALQTQKLQHLTEAIATNFDIQPMTYRAGRYGVGEETATILQDLGYQIDMSVLPGVNMGPIFGPDFRAALDKPYWFGERCRLLEIPANFCFTGLLASPEVPRAVPIRVYEQISRPTLNRLARSLGLFARLRLLERIPLTAEGTTLEELRRLTSARLKIGERVFVFGYHSSSLLPGSTQYVRSPFELSRFLQTIEGYLEFFISEIGGVTMTPSELRSYLVRTSSERVAPGDAQLRSPPTSNEAELAPIAGPSISGTPQAAGALGLIISADADRGAMCGLLRRSVKRQAALMQRQPDHRTVLESRGGVTQNPLLVGTGQAHAETLVANRVNVLICTNSAYLQHATVCLVSLLSNNPELSFEIVVVGRASEDLDEARMRGSLVKFRNYVLRVHKFTPPDDRLLPLNPRAHYTLDNWTRLWVQDFFPEDVQRVLYLDSDIVITGSIAPLWRTELNGALLGVVDIPGSDRGVLHLGLNADAGYFNSGVLLIDLTQWRETRALETVLNYVEANPDKMMRDVDQEALNACFHDRKKRLDYKWNAIRPFFDEPIAAPLTTEEREKVRKEARIIHFNGSSKPWSYFCTHPRKDEYEKYLLLTEWRNFVPEDRTLLNRIRKSGSMILPQPVKAVLKPAANLVLGSRRLKS